MKNNTIYENGPTGVNSAAEVLTDEELDEKVDFVHLFDTEETDENIDIDNEVAGALLMAELEESGVMREKIFDFDEEN